MEPSSIYLVLVQKGKRYKGRKKWCMHGIEEDSREKGEKKKVLWHRENTWQWLRRVCATMVGGWRRQ